MFNRKKMEKQRNLLQIKINRGSSKIHVNYRQKRETLRNEASKNGTLNSGLFMQKFKQNELEQARELVTNRYDSFKSVYCRRGFTKKYKEDFLKTLEEFEGNNLSGFTQLLQREPCILQSMKPRVIEIYKEELRRIVGEQKSSVEIEALERNIRIKEKYDEPLKVEKIFYRISSLWEESKIKAFGLVIFILFTSISFIRQIFEIAKYLLKKF